MPTSKDYALTQAFLGLLKKADNSGEVIELLIQEVYLKQNSSIPKLGKFVNYVSKEVLPYYQRVMDSKRAVKEVNNYLREVIKDNSFTVGSITLPTDNSEYSKFLRLVLNTVAENCNEETFNEIVKVYNEPAHLTLASASSHLLAKVNEICGISTSQIINQKIKEENLEKWCNFNKLVNWVETN